MAFMNEIRSMIITGVVRHNKRSTIRKHNLIHRKFSLQRDQNEYRILGIETSCDDTGCAVVNSVGNVLGESLRSQLQTHVMNGGILPPLAARLHARHIESVLEETLSLAGMSMSDIDAVAATVKPGLALSLEVGTRFGCHLSQQWKKPFIPIHHMEAHALTTRMIDKAVQFPFLCLLISGGHSLLALAESVDSFLLLGETTDDSPGELLDKVARRMKLHNIPELRKCSGGQAIELMARKATNPTRFEYIPALLQYRDCDFSFGGIKAQVWKHLTNEEKEYGVEGDGIIESASDFCASVQLVIAQHICHRVLRAMVFVETSGMLPRGAAQHTLVVSGGVACNQFFKKALKIVCDTEGYHLSIPPPSLCNDNGAMIAWNGVERFRSNLGILPWDQLQSVQVQPKSQLGKDIRVKVRAAHLKVPVIKRHALL